MDGSQVREASKVTGSLRLLLHQDAHYRYKMPALEIKIEVLVMPFSGLFLTSGTSSPTWVKGAGKHIEVQRKKLRVFQLHVAIRQEGWSDGSRMDQWETSAVRPAALDLQVHQRNGEGTGKGVRKD
eukprot:767814-Hanusia_phi.AAC.2